MKALRTIASALCIVLGAMLIASWAASTAALDAVENGTVIEDATARAITTPLAQDALLEHGTDAVLNALEGAGFNTDIVGFKLIVSNLVGALIGSQAFVDTVHAQTASIREQTVDALNAGGEGAITVTLDFSDQVNDKLGEIPVIGSALPTIAVPGVPVEVLDASAAETARTSWHWLHVAEKWFGWAGLALIAIGILVSYRKRWFFAKVALAVGVMAALIWAAMTFLNPTTLAERLPGGGVADAVIVEIVNHAKVTVANTMGYVALGAMMVALVLFILAARQKKGDR